MRKFLFVMLAVTLLAVPAMASVQSVKVSGDIDSTYIIRNNFNLAGNGNSQDVLITQTRLRIDADLTDKVSATIALINERAWGSDASSSDTGTTEIDLNLAYVTMREMLYSPLTVTLGRQEFAFGNSFVIDSAGPNNSASTASGLREVAGDLTKQTAQDAIRLTFDYDPLTIDVLYAAIDQGSVNLDKVSDDTDLFGINAAYQLNDERNTLVEGYFWVKDDKDKIYMPGIRGSINITDAWNLQAEAAYQFGKVRFDGDANTVDRRAYAGQILSNYFIQMDKVRQYQPVLGLSYTLMSGDEVWNTTGNSAGSQDVYKGWDPMYENQAGGKIFNALFNASNIHVIGASLNFVPLEDIGVNLYYDYLVLDKETDFALVSPTAASTSLVGLEEEESDVGQELGMVVTYDYTEDVQFGARAGWFFPGNRFDNTGETASQLLLNAKVSF